MTEEQYLKILVKGLKSIIISQERIFDKIAEKTNFTKTASTDFNHGYADAVRDILRIIEDEKFNPLNL